MLKKNLFSNFTGQIYSAIANFLILPQYLKILGPESFGLIGIYLLLQPIFLILDGGLLQSIFREIARLGLSNEKSKEIRDLLRSVEILISLIAIFIIFTGVALKDYISTNWININELDINSVENSFLCITILIALRLIEGIYRNTLLGLQKQSLYNLIFILYTTLKTFGVLIFLKFFISPNITNFFVLQIICSIIFLSFLISSSYAQIPNFMPNKSIKIKFSPAAIKRIWKFSTYVFFVTLISTLIGQIDKLVLSKMLPLSEFGYYTIASTISTSLITFVIPITNAYYPRFCEKIKNYKRKELSNDFHTSAQIVSILIGSLSFLIIFNSYLIINLWTQNAETAIYVSKISKILVLGTLINTCLWIPTQIQFAFGWTKLALYSNIFGIFLITFILNIFVPIYGAIGASFCWLSLNIVYFFSAIIFMFRKIMRSHKWKWLIQDLILPLTPPLIICFFSSLLINYFSSFYQITLLIFTLIISIVFSIYFSKDVKYKMLTILRK